MAGAALLTLNIFAGWVPAQGQPDSSGLGQAQFEHPGLFIADASRPGNALPPQAAAQATADLAALGAGTGARVDVPAEDGPT